MTQLMLVGGLICLMSMSPEDNPKDTRFLIAGLTMLGLATYLSVTE